LLNATCWSFDDNNTFAARQHIDCSGGKAQPSCLSLREYFKNKLFKFIFCLPHITKRFVHSLGQLSIARNKFLTEQLVKVIKN
jgi:hypothetical protein